MDAGARVGEVAAGRGAGWLAEAWGLFRRRPLAWIALTAGWLVVTFGLIIIPIIGGVVANFLQPAFFASFALAAIRQVQGEPIGMGDLFLGFRKNLRALVNLGAILLIVEIAIFALMALLGLPLATSSDKSFTMAEYIEMLKDREWILAVGFALTVSVKGALWFAPPLIALRDMSMAHAMRWSTYAALSNVGAMIVYGLALMALFFAALVPWGLGLIVVIPMMAISTYVGYRDVFESSSPPPSPGPSGP
jgi:membrane-anchored glycerophosphoryl diester phosphodiesterase (GDPDase)